MPVPVRGFGRGPATRGRALAEGEGGVEEGDRRGDVDGEDGLEGQPGAGVETDGDMGQGTLFVNGLTKTCEVDRVRAR